MNLGILLFLNMAPPQKIGAGTPGAILGGNTVYPIYCKGLQENDQ